VAATADFGTADRPADPRPYAPAGRRLASTPAGLAHGAIAAASRSASAQGSRGWSNVPARTAKPSRAKSADRVPARPGHTHARRLAASRPGSNSPNQAAARAQVRGRLAQAHIDTHADHRPSARRAHARRSRCRMPAELAPRPASTGQLGHLSRNVGMQGGSTDRLTRHAASDRPDQSVQAPAAGRAKRSTTGSAPAPAAPEPLPPQAATAGRLSLGAPAAWWAASGRHARTAHQFGVGGVDLGRRTSTRQARPCQCQYRFATGPPSSRPCIEPFSAGRRLGAEHGAATVWQHRTSRHIRP
jgi:hypothetical protein